VGDILEIVLDVLGEDPRVTREAASDWAATQVVHRFDDGVVFQGGNELHIHFFSPNWFYVKRCLTEVAQRALEEYPEVYTVTDIEKVKKALMIFGCEEIDGKLVLTRERFRDVWCK
jgi:hypothetical protein